MSDSDGKKTLGLRGAPRSGNVKQSFSHGRTKSVVVETKRKRVVVPKAGAAKPAGSQYSTAASKKRPAGISDAEMDRRLKAVQAAKARETEELANREAQDKARAEERERRRSEQEEKEREQREAEERARQKSEQEEQERKDAEEKAKQAAAAAKAAETKDRGRDYAPNCKTAASPRFTQKRT